LSCLKKQKQDSPTTRVGRGGKEQYHQKGIFTVQGSKKKVAGKKNHREELGRPHRWGVLKRRKPREKKQERGRSLVGMKGRYPLSYENRGVKKKNTFQQKGKENTQGELWIKRFELGEKGEGAHWSLWQI